MEYRTENCVFALNSPGMKVLLLLSAVFLCNVDGYNILIQIGLGSPSHKMAMIPLAEELANRGHRVIFVSPFASNEPTPYEDLAPKETVEWNLETLEKHDVVLERLESDLTMFVASMPFYMPESCEVLMQTEVYDKFINREIKLDVIITDPTSGECAVALAQHLQIPFIYFTTTGWYTWMSEPLGVPPMITYKPGLLNRGFTDVSRFWDRLAFTVDHMYWTLTKKYYMFPRVQKAWEKRLGHSVPSLFDYEKNVSLVLTNGHHVTELPAALTPNVIDIGGSHLPAKIKPLPDEMKAFADKGDFVFFGLGSFVSTKNIPEHLLTSFIETFKKLKVNVIWKFNADEKYLEGKLSPNVRVFNWVPQFDVLAHPNCKVFVTHGGKLGTTEAAYHGVPVVVIPFFTDQDGHAALAQREGYGLHQDLTEITDTLLFEKVQRLLEDLSFRKRAAERRDIMRDELVPPVKRGAYWVEYVIRHKGAPHLRPHARHLSWYQFHLVDVWLFILAVAFLIVFVPVYILKKILKSLFRDKVKRD